MPKKSLSLKDILIPTTQYMCNWDKLKLFLESSGIPLARFSREAKLDRAYLHRSMNVPGFHGGLLSEKVSIKIVNWFDKNGYN